MSATAVTAGDAATNLRPPSCAQPVFLDRTIGELRAALDGAPELSDAEVIAVHTGLRQLAEVVVKQFRERQRRV